MAKEGPVTPFIILANQRSGSNMLALALHNPPIHCYGELFRRGCPSWRRPPKLRYLPTNNRFSHYLSQLRRTHANRIAVGFKLMYAQAPAARKWILRNREWSVIWLRRPNRLAQFASLVNAKRNKKGVLLSGEQDGEEQLPFDPDWFDGHRESMDYRESFVLAEMQGADGPTLEITYPELCQQGFDPVCDLLDIDPSRIEAKTEKRQGSNIAERFQDPDRVRHHLMEIGHPEWEIEDTGG